MKCFLRKSLRGWEPTDDNALEVHKRTKLGEVVRADIVKPRNYQHHKLFFALLSLTYDNQTDYTDPQMFRRAVALEAGHCRVTAAFDGTTVLSPLSYSYDDIPDEHEFTAAFAAAMEVCARRLGGIGLTELEEHVRAYADEHFGRAA